MSGATTSTNRKLPKTNTEGKSDTKIIAAANSGAVPDRSMQAAAIENLWNYLELQSLVKVEQMSDNNSRVAQLKNDEINMQIVCDTLKTQNKSMAKENLLESSSIADDLHSTDEQNFDDSLKQFSNDFGRICDWFNNRV